MSKEGHLVIMMLLDIYCVTTELFRLNSFDRGEEGSGGGLCPCVANPSPAMQTMTCDKGYAQK
jgi:hypothetical protein